MGETKMSLIEYRTSITAKLVKLEERQISIFKSLQRIEKGMDKVDIKINRHDHVITQIQTYGTVGVLVIPVIVSIIMRLI